MPVLPHIETSPLICFANQLTGFNMRAPLAFNGLKCIKFWTPGSVEWPRESALSVVQ